jgi:hypothetical protein
VQSVPNVVLLVAIAVAGIHCGAAVVPGPTSGGMEGSSPGKGSSAVIDLRFDETVEYRDLKLRLVGLDDSRCPIGVTCVWEGQIVATLEVARGAEGSVELEMVRRAGIEPETSRAFDHELVLQGVDPHPQYGVTRERSEYVAHIEIVDP